MSIARVPARYIGSHDVLLKGDGPFLDAAGQPLRPVLKNAVTKEAALGLRPGDTLLMPAEEVLGCTYLHDPLQVAPSEYLGAGHVVKTEHQALPYEELMALGYDFHEGRADFELIQEEASQQEEQQPVAFPVIPTTPTNIE